MLSHETICEKVKLVAPLFPLKKVSYFGSYAEGRQTDRSDLDLLVEFYGAASLIMLSDLKFRLEDELAMSVDVVPYPLPKGALITINKVVPVYEQ